MKNELDIWKELLTKTYNALVKGIGRYPDFGQLRDGHRDFIHPVSRKKNDVLTFLPKISENYNFLDSTCAWIKGSYILVLEVRSFQIQPYLEINIQETQVTKYRKKLFEIKDFSTLSDEQINSVLKYFNSSKLILNSVKKPLSQYDELVPAFVRANPYVVDVNATFAQLTKSFGQFEEIRYSETKYRKVVKDDVTLTRDITWVWPHTDTRKSTFTYELLFVTHVSHDPCAVMYDLILRNKTRDQTLISFNWQRGFHPATIGVIAFRFRNLM